MAWLHDARIRINQGYVHSVYTEAFIACLFKSSDRLVMQATSRSSGFRFTMETDRLPDDPSIRFLIDKASQLMGEFAIVPASAA
jgi:hypothetical protein